MLSELIEELVLEISKYKRIDLGEREAEFLARIGEGHDSSYKIFSHLKKVGLPMHYKNVNKRVTRLYELKLIKEAKGESIHNAKFFALTSEGIFYLLTKWQQISLPWLIEYKNNLILRVLLYPYFEEETIRPFTMLIELGRYFRECCHIILLSIDFIQRRQKEGEHTVKERVLKQLQVDLEWQAKELAFKLITKKTAFLYERGSYPIDYLWVEKSESRKSIGYSSNLIKDKKFIALSKSMGKEYERAFADFMKSAKKYE